MAKPEPLICGQYDHVYNRGNSGETLFREQRNYLYFLKLYGLYIEPIAQTFAYCLLPNHFHFLVRIEERQSREDLPLEDCRSYPPDDCRSLVASQAFATLFGTYTKAFNKAFQRTSSLFEKPFHRILVDNDRYFAGLVVYIHRNPKKHRFVADFCSWPYSSYKATLSDKPTHVQGRAVLAWFGDRAAFETQHNQGLGESIIEPLIADDLP